MLGTFQIKEFKIRDRLEILDSAFQGVQKVHTHKDIEKQTNKITDIILVICLIWARVSLLTLLVFIFFFKPFEETDTNTRF